MNPVAMLPNIVERYFPSPTTPIKIEYADISGDRVACIIKHFTAYGQSTAAYCRPEDFLKNAAAKTMLDCIQLFAPLVSSSIVFIFSTPTSMTNLIFSLGWGGKQQLPDASSLVR